MKSFLIVVLCILVLVVPSFGLSLDSIKPKLIQHNGTIKIIRVEGESIQVCGEPKDWIKASKIITGDIIIVQNGYREGSFSPVYDSLKEYTYSTLSNITDLEIVDVVSKYRIEYLEEQKEEELAKTQKESDRKNKTKVTIYTY